MASIRTNDKKNNESRPGTLVFLQEMQSPRSVAPCRGDVAFDGKGPNGLLVRSHLEHFPAPGIHYQGIAVGQALVHAAFRRSKGSPVLSGIRPRECQRSWII